jgi:ribosomal protein L21E
MAKLNGITLLGETLVLSGKQFAASTEKAAAGDIVKMGTSLTDAPKGDYFTVKSDIGQLFFTDNGGDRRLQGDIDTWVRQDNLKLFKPLDIAATAPITPCPNVGDFAKVIGGDNSYTKIGDIVKIVRIDRDGDYRIADLTGNDIDGCKKPKNVVLASASEIDAAKRALFPVGSSVTLVSGGGDYPLNGFRNNSVYKVTNNNRSHDGSTKIQLDACGYATVDQLTLNVPVVAPKPVRLTVGDYAKVIEAGNDSYLIDTFIEITVDDHTSIPYKARRADGTIGSYTIAGRLQRASKADFDAAVLALQPKPAAFKVGDSVKLTIADGKFPSSGYGEVSNGDIGVIYSINGNGVVVDFPKQSAWFGLLSEFTLATPADTEAAAWSAIGRKVGEFKTGDVVRVTDKHGSPVKVGGIYVVERPHSGRGVYIDGGWAVDCELVTPVESVFNAA